MPQFVAWNTAWHRWKIWENRRYKAMKKLFECANQYQNLHQSIRAVILCLCHRGGTISLAVISWRANWMCADSEKKSSLFQTRQNTFWLYGASDTNLMTNCNIGRLDTACLNSCQIARKSQDFRHVIFFACIILLDSCMLQNIGRRFPWRDISNVWYQCFENGLNWFVLIN